MDDSTFLQIQRDLATLSERRKGVWEALQGKVPKTLYHYTSVLGLQGILSRGKMWASDVCFLNDSTELLYAYDLICKTLDTSIRKSTSTPVIKDFLRRVYEGIARGELDIVVYASCFCEKQDVLSQWRAYGAMGGGYALGFKSETLRKSDYAAPPNFELRRVEYSARRQRRWVEETVGDVCNCLQAAPGRMDDRDLQALFRIANDALYELFIQALFCFKHPSFSEEKEWRLIHCPGPVVNPELLNFRPAPGKIVPYVELDLTTPSSDKARLLPLSEIRYGPMLNKKATETVLRQILRRYEYPEGIEIKQSQVPLTI